MRSPEDQLRVPLKTPDGDTYLLWLPDHPVKGIRIAPNQFAVEIEQARELSEHEHVPVHWEHAGIKVSTTILATVPDPIEWLKQEDKKLRQSFRDKKR